jgi:hypothetical protein
VVCISAFSISLLPLLFSFSPAFSSTFASTFPSFK